MFMSADLDSLLNQFKALADVHRLRIFALCQQGECSVGELTEVLGQSQPRVSQHLKQLCDAGLLERFRDGKRVYYRHPAPDSAAKRRLVGMIPESDPLFVSDLSRLFTLRGAGLTEAGEEESRDPVERSVYRALLDQTVAAPLGDLLDVGCGRGRILKLLARRASRAIGVDIDADARDIARAELLFAGLPNCSLRQGDMYRLPFADADFDTIVLDDVLLDARHPRRVLREARRLLRPAGRLFVLLDVSGTDANAVVQRLAEWCAASDLRVALPRLVPSRDPSWLLSVATVAESTDVAA